MSSSGVTLECTSVSIDIAFVLDSSGSVGSYYQTEKNFIKSIATAFGISQNGAHGGVVTFSNMATLSIRLDSHYDTISFNNAVDAIPFMNSGNMIL